MRNIIIILKDILSLSIWKCILFFIIRWNRFISSIQKSLTSCSWPMSLELKILIFYFFIILLLILLINNRYDFLVCFLIYYSFVLIDSLICCYFLRFWSRLEIHLLNNKMRFIIICFRLESCYILRIKSLLIRVFL